MSSLSHSKINPLPPSPRARRVRSLAHLLPSSEFELSTPQRLDDVGLVDVLGPDGDQNLSDGHTRGDSDGLSVGVPHSGTEAISSGARKHLVGAEDVEGVGAHADVVAVLSNGLGQVLVDGDAGGLESLGGDLLLLVAHHVGDKGEEIDGGLLGANIVNADLGVGHSTAVPTLDVGLVLLVAVATAGAASHFGFFLWGGEVGFWGIGGVVC